MRKDIEIWVEALRSGKYKQTKDTLHNLDDGGYCCLGVYAKVNKLATDEFMGRERKLVSIEGINYAETSLDEGPLEIYKKITEKIGSDLKDTLISMNDSGTPFNEIADYIEEVASEVE